MSTLGKTAIGGTSDNPAGNVLLAFGPYAVSGNGSLTKITAYVAKDAANLIIAAVYADNSGSPGALLAQSAEGSLASGSFGWVDFDMQTPLAITNGTNYWLVLYASAAWQIKYDAVGGPPASKYQARAYDSDLPDPFVVGGSIAVEYSVYATYSTLTPTITNITIPSTGDQVVWTLNEAITTGAGGNGGVAVTLSGGAATATYASGTGTSTIAFSLSRIVGETETGTGAYTQPGNGWEDGAGTDLVTFSGTSITNNAINAPTLLSCSVNSTAVTASWSDNSAEETGYTFQYATSGTSFASPTSIDIPPGTSTADPVELAAGDYEGRVRAYKVAGPSLWSNTASFSVPGSDSVVSTYRPTGNLAYTMLLGLVSRR